MSYFIKKLKIGGGGFNPDALHCNFYNLKQPDLTQNNSPPPPFPTFILFKDNLVLTKVTFWPNNQIIILMHSWNSYGINGTARLQDSQHNLR